MIRASDEQLHEPGAAAHWQESFYFNWADAGGTDFGLARIGYRFGQDRCDGLVLSIGAGRPRFCYPGVDLRGVAPAVGSPPGAFRAGRLTFTVEEPLRRFRLTLEGRHRMDLVWEAFTDPFDFTTATRQLGPELAAAHFEQAGTVHGWTEFHGRRRRVEGLGQRDKSWGPRDWGTLAGWDWISAQFGTDIAFNATVVRSGDGGRLPSGFLHENGVNHELVDVDVAYDWGRRAHEPAAVRLHLTGADGREWRVRGEAIGRFPLYRKGAWLEEVHTGFVLEGETGSRSGYGLVEHVWRPSTVEVLRRAGQLPGLVRVTVPR